MSKDSVDRRYCSSGLFETFILEYGEKGKYDYYFNTNGERFMLVCNVNEKSMKWRKRQNDNKFVDSDVENQIKKNVIKEISEDGSRWEGDWLNDKPFGYGSIYDGEGNKIYSGFMFEGKKIAFGEEYFADNHEVDYCGNYVNDLRHGWGTTYDRNGNTLYEGDWRFGKNDFEERIVIRNEEDCLIFHDLIKELEFEEDCFNEWKDDLAIENYPNLERIIVKENSLNNLNSLKICNCEILKMIEVEDTASNNVKNVIIESISINIK